MTTKEEGFIFKKLLSVANHGLLHDYSNQFSNFNINQDHKCPSLVQSFSKSNNHKFSGGTVNNDYKEERKAWNKSTNDSSLMKSKNSRLSHEAVKETENQKRWKTDKEPKKLNSSTLSLHITAYENYIESLSNNDTNNLQPKSSASKFVDPLSKLHNDQDLPEFPRQMADDEPSTTPEVQQFAASQRLYTPNQGASSSSQMQSPRMPQSSQTQLNAFILSHMSIPLCSSCFKAIGDNLEDTKETAEYQQCCLCFGLLEPSIYDKIIEKTKEEYSKNGYDGRNFVLAVNFPVSQLLRELFIQKIMGDKWDEMMMSPKSRLTYNLMAKFRQDGFLRPSLAGDLTATVTFENNEFVQRDAEFFLCHKPAGFLNAGNRKRKAIDDEEISNLFTKVKVQYLVDQLSLDVIKSFTFTSPTRSLDIAVGFQRDVLYIGGRYCKYSRSLPQSPWTPNHETPKIKGNSVAEKVSSSLEEYFRCDSTKFIASGREDVDVRMLGKGRPFAIVLQNARKWIEMYTKESREKTLQMLKEKINSKNKDIQIGDLAVVSQKETQLLNVGQEEKKKTYTALCYSHQKVTEEMAKKLEAAMPIEINQLTPIRVLFRRPLIDRPRTIHSAKIQILDDHYFYLKVETQAGTYVKEFVHSDFGRTKPSVATLMGFEFTDGMSILELDVEGVDLEWPPPSKKELKEENEI